MTNCPEVLSTLRDFPGHGAVDVKALPVDFVCEDVPEVVVSLLRTGTGETLITVDDLQGNLLETFGDKHIHLELTADTETLDQWISCLKTEVLPGLLSLLGYTMKSRTAELRAFENDLSELRGTEDYQFFGLDEAASDKDVEKAYRVCAARLHPDKGGDEAAFQDMKRRYDHIKEMRQENVKPSTEDGEIEWDRKDRKSMVKAHADLHAQLVWIMEQISVVRTELERLRVQRQSRFSLADDCIQCNAEAKPPSLSLTKPVLAASQVKAVAAQIGLPPVSETGIAFASRQVQPAKGNSQVKASGPAQPVRASPQSCGGAASQEPAKTQQLQVFEINDRVTWKKANEDVPRASIGIVVGLPDAVRIQVRFAKGTFIFKAEELLKMLHPLGKSAQSISEVQQFGFRINDRVTWTNSDEDVPEGSVGMVVGFTDTARVQVKFPKDTFNFKPEELLKKLVPLGIPPRRKPQDQPEQLCTKRPSALPGSF